MAGKQRFVFIDQFRGLVGVMMALGHSSYYFNAVWKSLDPLDPFFSNFGQFALRYMGYLCAPGFLMMNGAMTWYSYTSRRKAGKSEWSAKWHLIQRGLFLVLAQLTWVNASWSGFKNFRLAHEWPPHIGIIACIGISMCLLALIVNTRWQIRLAVGLGAFLLHQILLDTIPRTIQDTSWFVQYFVSAGEFNKYPVMPWFGLATMGSVMATGWLQGWKTTRRRISTSLIIAGAAYALAIAVRMGRGFGNLTPFSTFFHYSFFLDTKYPPSLYHNLWFFATVVFMMAMIQLIGSRFPAIPRPLGTIGRVPLFFYCIHIAILGVISKRLGLFYHQGGVAASLIGWVALLVVMYPIARWFGGEKQRAQQPLSEDVQPSWRVPLQVKNYVVQLI